MSVPGIDEGKGAAGGTDIDRLPETVQNQHLTVQRGLQIFPSCRLASPQGEPSAEIGAKISPAIFIVNLTENMPPNQLVDLVCADKVEIWLAKVPPETCLPRSAAFLSLV